MQKKEIIQFSITGVLIFILLFTIIRAVKKGEQSKDLEIKKTQPPAFKKEERLERKFSHEKITPEELFRILKEESKNLKLRRDPFFGALIITEEESPSGISLNGIFWDEKNPMAIINDEIVKIGDRVGGYIVIEIKKERVILNDGTSNLELRL